MSNSLRPHEPQHVRPPCPSSAPGVHPNSCPLSRWYHPAISSSVIPFSCLQSFPVSGSFPKSQFFTWGGQSIGVTASASVLLLRLETINLLQLQSAWLCAICFSPNNIWPSAGGCRKLNWVDLSLNFIRWIKWKDKGWSWESWQKSDWDGGP